MKRIIAALLICLSSISFASCGSIDQSSAQETSASIKQDESSRDKSGIESNGEKDDMNAKIMMRANGYSFAITLENNKAVSELLDMMKDNPLSLDLSDYGGFEKVGPLGSSLTREDKQTTTEAGDIVLYNGNNIVVFYGSNSWSYTRLGHVDDITNLASALGSGDVTITFSLK